MKANIIKLVLIISIFAINNVFGQMTILSGPEQGSYYQFVNDIKTVLGNEEDKKLSIRLQGCCHIILNNWLIRHHQLNYALIQSDYLYLYTIYLTYWNNTE